MSTRSQIRIKGRFDQQVMLYRHCDGYPTGGNVALIAGAHANMGQGQSWQADRAGKVASHVVALAPEHVEVLGYVEAHDDIEWLYDLDVSVNPWRLRVLSVQSFPFDEKNARVAFDGPITEALPLIEQMEQEPGQ